ncbi:MAG: aminopeptidase P family protein [Cyclobacteriaceae bacterium]|nr:aminopeptidase P family protein [Cyclobacteriaceae bacterium]MCH8515195.1 aminopeptidase P family protein [Cyclobacteriaceae bacterium]
MRYTPLESTLFQKNRRKFAKLMRPNSMAILNSNDIMPTNADGTMGFKQNSDLFYLTNIDQEESVLLFFPDAKEPQDREILFVIETNEHIAVWEGHKYSKEEAIQASGIKNVKWLSELDSTIHRLGLQAESIYYNKNEHPRNASAVETRDERFFKKLKSLFPLHNYERLAPLMHQLRPVKEAEEIEVMRHACSITEKGFRRILSFVKPGVHEFEIEAEFLHEFIRNRSNGFAYDPIIASGKNACVLHYLENKDECKDGDLILFDVGAVYGNYASDMSRTIPVNGRFTERQRAVYDAVLRVMKEAYKILVPGNTIVEYHKQVGSIMEKELIGLGLLDKTDIKNQDPNWPAYKKYFMHGTSHHIGLDVHDVGDVYRKIEEGMVFTVEPGIYIPDENIGIRLENDVVIKTDGHDDLMANIPIEAEHIEELMNQ